MIFSTKSLLRDFYYFCGFVITDTNDPVQFFNNNLIPNSFRLILSSEPSLNYGFDFSGSERLLGLMSVFVYRVREESREKVVYVGIYGGGWGWWWWWWGEGADI